MHKFCKFFFTFVMVFVFCLSCGATQMGKPVFIDSRLLVLAHPLFKAFDPKTGRFKGTSSEPFVYDVGSRKDFIQKIKDTEDYLLNSSERLREKIKKVPFKDRIKIEKEFLYEKRMLELKLEVMKRRVYLSRLVPINDGMTPYSSIYPQCKAITETVKEICEELKGKYKTKVVIDIANLLPIIKKTRFSQVCYAPNLIYSLNKKKNVTDGQLKNWISEVDVYWAQKQGIGADVIPVGAVDVRLEAVKLMEEKGSLYKIWDWEK